MTYDLSIDNQGKFSLDVLLIEWKAVFLIAGMLPLRAALDKSGAARQLAEDVADSLGPFGPCAALFGLLVISFWASIIPTAAQVALMVSFVLKTSAIPKISPHAWIISIPMAASFNFITIFFIHPTYR